MSFLWLGGDLPFWRWKEGQAWTFLAGASSFYSWNKLLYKIRYMKTKTLTWLVSKAPVVAVWIFVNSRGELVRRDHVRMSKPGLGVRWRILGSWGVGRWSTPKEDPTFRSTFFFSKVKFHQHSKSLNSLKRHDDSCLCMNGTHSWTDLRYVWL